MLIGFTWGQFLLASFVLSFLWYCFVALVFYQDELRRFLSGGSVGAVPLSHRWEKGVDDFLENADLDMDLRSKISQTELDVDDGLMGKSALPQGMAVMAMEQLCFAGSTEDRYEQVGFVADVIQDLKLIFSELEDTAGSKRDFFRLLQKMKQEYGKVGAHPSVARINGFIFSHAPFHLSADELENLWV